ncbi:KpsF/GutQ family sugar-phosphate isomerase [Candidatus Liberibacter solanacearum]|uniref:D-arabinose 5-phosphate n=1 Tax=Candidatus Liberibacter solanacearum TaxID=556287 RepID=A0A1V2N7E4_9HYPH|nr:KpsF/GutQ family sugar-phosphate isomerase [Candidatus Liberibacter solanacearum]ONI58803.1 D-arabinose 5-phosphate [Candidatus Liberibacter solanacearum]ONI59451.1 D-arabinose 5-phosphate [Candidatus Liberibacter solanacearum]
MSNLAIQSALQSIEIGKKGLSSLESSLLGELSSHFSRAVETIKAIRGRVVVTGIGKSGHIGSKLASTFASTGTPSFFVHAAEANHGDLGMITQDDVIIALSWSGESNELKAILCHARRFSIPLIAITSENKSILACHADIVLKLPKEPEACPYGLAPTTSTIMQLAIGDALAMALMETENFTENDFYALHPGGKLGSLFTCATDVMHTGTRLPLVKMGSLLIDAIPVLSEKRFGCIAVVDEDQRLKGIVTEGDIFRNFRKNLNVLTVEDIMTKNPKVISEDTLLTVSMQFLKQHNISVLMVVDANQKIIGIVHFLDLLRFGIA